MNKKLVEGDVLRDIEMKAFPESIYTVLKSEFLNCAEWKSLVFFIGFDDDLA